jgi:hypothetical protein
MPERKVTRGFAEIRKAKDPLAVLGVPMEATLLPRAVAFDDADIVMEDHRGSAQERLDYLGISYSEALSEVEARFLLALENVLPPSKDRDQDRELPDRFISTNDRALIVTRCALIRLFPGLNAQTALEALVRDHRDMTYQELVRWGILEALLRYRTDTDEDGLPFAIDRKWPVRTAGQVYRRGANRDKKGESPPPKLRRRAAERILSGEWVHEMGEAALDRNTRQGAIVAAVYESLLGSDDGETSYLTREEWEKIRSGVLLKPSTKEVMRLANDKLRRVPTRKAWPAGILDWHVRYYLAQKLTVQAFDSAWRKYESAHTPNDYFSIHIPEEKWSQRTRKFPPQAKQILDPSFPKRLRDWDVRDADFDKMAERAWQGNWGACSEGLTIVHHR